MLGDQALVGCQMLVGYQKLVGSSIGWNLHLVGSRSWAGVQQVRPSYILLSRQPRAGQAGFDIFCLLQISILLLRQPWEGQAGGVNMALLWQRLLGKEQAGWGYVLGHLFLNLL